MSSSPHMPLCSQLAGCASASLFGRRSPMTEDIERLSSLGRLGVKDERVETMIDQSVEVWFGQFRRELKTGGVARTVVAESYSSL